MASPPLSTRLQALADTYKTTLTLIQRLQNLPTTPGTHSTSHSSDPRVELSSEIHQALKEQEDELETLRQELDDDDATRTFSGVASVKRRRDSEQVRERERSAALVAKMGEDLKIARSAFRKAQLDAKRNADAAKRRERELLFANRSKDADGAVMPARRKGQEKLTADELALEASSDVTAALRRTHALLQSNIEQSQFAQQTLDESSSALAELSESYAGLDSLLKSSGGLVRQLIRSNKSDTWYLTTAFYMLVVTFSWLVFRRILYGPLWWLVWQPLKLVWWLVVMVMTGVGAVGGQKGGVVSSSISKMSMSMTQSNVERPTFAAERPAAFVPVGGKGGGWGVQRPQEIPGSHSEKKEKSMVDQIGEMVEGKVAEKDGEPGEETVLKERPEDDPPNPKKRMYEQENGIRSQKRDEL